MTTLLATLAVPPYPTCPCTHPYLDHLVVPTCTHCTLTQLPTLAPLQPRPLNTHGAYGHAPPSLHCCTPGSWLSLTAQPLSLTPTSHMGWPHHSLLSCLPAAYQLTYQSTPYSAACQQPATLLSHPFSNPLSHGLTYPLTSPLTW